MELFWIIFVIVLSAIAIFVIISFLLCYITAWIVYDKTLVKSKEKMWGRNISEPGNIELQQMWDKGIEWAQSNKEAMKEVSIVNDGLSLKGELYDFGGDETVIILPGRRECLIYSYFYAFPYKELSINVLVVDPRAHGYSDGKYSTLGILEADDVSIWIKLLINKYHQKNIYLHGICVGTTCSINVMRKNECSKYIKGAVLDSCCISFKEIYSRHMLELGHKLWPVFNMIWWHFKRCTNLDVNCSNPLKYISEVDAPICFIWGEKDKYCLKEKNMLIYEKCNSNIKEYHFFEEAGHSKIRFNDEKRYDGIIKTFIEKL